MAEEAVPTLEEEEGRTRFEQAKICSKCGKPGKVVNEYPAPLAAGLKVGTKIVVVNCMTEATSSQIECPWYGTGWSIQVNPDGTTPPPRNHTFSEKYYVHDPDADAIIKRIEESLTQQLVVETQRDGHGEIQN